MKKPTDLESRILEILDSNIRLIQYSVYTVGLIGLAIIARSTHIFNKFTSAKSVPREFIRKAVKLQGKVNGIEYCQLPLQQVEGHQPNYALRFNVEHIPIARLLPWKDRKALEKSFLLDIELVGVHLTTLEGVDNLIKIPVESNPTIWFRLYGLNCETNHIYASIFLKRAWWKFWVERDLALIILKQNKGIVSPYLTNSQHIYFNEKYPAYYRKLLYCEIKYRKL
ncbi:protein C3orf33 homolog [Daphnia carinata]|uniref:protein C3orf33 homolog n=1 Tax=Daphnia carinata TaxID=120202 RepID=UPI00257ED16E|nr:protein C3orf33 homolog [Daphnia carinata]